MTIASTGLAPFGGIARHRKGVAAILAASMIVVLLGLAALALDIGYLYMNRGQLQTSADSGSLAGAQVLVHDGLVKAVPDYATGQTNARATAVQYASANRVGINLPSVDSNSSNSTDGDVVLGYMSDPSDPNCTLDFSNPLLYNAVQVRVRKDSKKNGLVESFFSRIWGNPGEPLAARATSVVSSSIVGFKVTSESGNADLMPFAVKKESWDAVMAAAGTDQYTVASNEVTAGPHDDSVQIVGTDNYTVSSTGVVSGGSDGIMELSMYPLENDAAGNFGTVDVGSADNSTNTLDRQIRSGVSAQDLGFIGGSLVLGSDGTLQLNGDTGVSAALKDALLSVQGKPKAIMLYSTVTDNGNNATYTIVGFVGIRVLHVKLTGSPKYVIVQPSAVIDASALIGKSPNQSKYLYSNVRLVR